MTADSQTHLDREMDARRQALELTWRDVADAAQVSDQGLRDIRSGKSSPRPKTKRRIEDALGWAKGSFDAVRDGGAPRLAPMATREGRLVAEAAERAGLSHRRAAVQAGLPDDTWKAITTSDRSPSPVDLARAAHVVGLRPDDLEHAGRHDAARELRMIGSWESQDAAPEGSWADDTERAIWKIPSLTQAEKASLIAQVRVSRVSPTKWPDPAEREIWDLTTLSPAERASLIVLLRVSRITEDLREKVRASDADTQDRRAAG